MAGAAARRGAADEGDGAAAAAGRSLGTVPALARRRKAAGPPAGRRLDGAVDAGGQRLVVCPQRPALRRAVAAAGVCRLLCRHDAGADGGGPPGRLAGIPALHDLGHLSQLLGRLRHAAGCGAGRAALPARSDLWGARGRLCGRAGGADPAASAPQNRLHGDAALLPVDPFAAVGVVAISFLAFILQYFQMQGRYLYPAMLPICLLLALGWRGVFPPRYRDLASGMLLALLAAAAAAFLRSVAPL